MTYLKYKFHFAHNEHLEKKKLLWVCFTKRAITLLYSSDVCSPVGFYRIEFTSHCCAELLCFDLSFLLQWNIFYCIKICMP